MTPEQIASVRALIEARRLTERTRTTWDGDTRGREMVATTDALEALLAAVEPLDERPDIEVGDLFYAFGEWREPSYEWNSRVEGGVLAFYHIPLDDVERIIKADGRQWRKPADPEGER